MICARGASSERCRASLGMPDWLLRPLRSWPSAGPAFHGKEEWRGDMPSALDAVRPSRADPH